MMERFHEKAKQWSTQNMRNVNTYLFYLYTYKYRYKLKIINF